MSGDFTAIRSAGAPDPLPPLPGAIFLDWDGTLVDTLPYLRRVHNHVRGVMNLTPWSEAEFREVIRYSTREIYDRIYGPDSRKAQDILYAHVENTHLDGLQVLNGAAELLTCIRELNVPMGIVSNKKTKYLAQQIGHLGWRDYFVSIVGAGEAARDKPEADPLHLALEKAQMKLPYSRIWYVGDSETDLLCARNARCHAVFLSSPEQAKSLVQTYKPLLAAKNCVDFHQILLQYGIK